MQSHPGKSKGMRVEDLPGWGFVLSCRLDFCGCFGSYFP